MDAERFYSIRHLRPVTIDGAGASVGFSSEERRTQMRSNILKLFYREERAIIPRKESVIINYMPNFTEKTST